MWNVLVVDDSATSRALLERILVRMGHRPLVADCGARALSICEVEHPDIMLLDVMMPDIDGWELAARLREIDSLRSVPIVFQSSVETQEEIDRCLACGASEIIAKPVRAARLEGVFISLLGIPMLPPQFMSMRPMASIAALPYSMPIGYAV